MASSWGVRANSLSLTGLAASQSADPSSVLSLLTSTQAAQALCVSERTVRSPLTDGKLPVARFGRDARIDPSYLRRFIGRAKSTDAGATSRSSS